MFRNKAFLTILVLLFSTAAHAGVPQAASAVSYCNFNSVTSNGGSAQLGGNLFMPEANITALSTNGYKVLVAAFPTAAGSAAAFYGFHELSAGSNSQFKVPSGKKFYEACHFAMSNVTAFGGFQFVTSTAAIASDGTTTVPTGAIYDGGATGLYIWPTGQSAAGYTIPMGWSVPRIFDGSSADLYLSIQTDANPVRGGVIMVGKLL